MSVEAVRWALDDAPVDDPTRALVLIALAEHAHKDGRNARPSIATIASRARVSIRSVHVHIKALRRDGIITETGKTRTGVVVYALDLERRRGVQPTSGVQPTTGEARCTPGVQPDADPGVQPDADEVCSPLHTNRNEPTAGTTNEPPSSPAERAEAVTKAWWESFEPRPSGSYVGFRNLIRSLIRAGWDADAVLGAARRCGRTFNRAAIERELDRTTAGRGVSYGDEDRTRAGAVMSAADWRAERA